MSKVYNTTIDESIAHFQIFSKVVQHHLKIAGVKASNDNTLLQQEQVNSLSALELKFRDELLSSDLAETAYNRFIEFITEDLGNILRAKPYFRERKDAFQNHIARALKEKDWKALKGFHVNYLFINIVTKNWDWKSAEQQKLRPYLDQIIKVRKALVTINMPLVINRVKVFWSRTQKSHLSYMDLIQIGAEGLMNGIDKYCGQYDRRWRGVAIGRMVGNFIECYSQTVLHLFPSDRRKLYRANKYRAKHVQGEWDMAELVKTVEVLKDGRTVAKSSVDEILELLAASSPVSCDTTPVSEDKEGSDNIANYEAPYEDRPDYQCEMWDAQLQMLACANKLPLYDRKLLRLKGLDIDLD
jgi:DNA-directed RNA polymerase specialized sigma subunit